MIKDKKVKSVNDIDRYIGQRLRVRRMMLKLSQTDLAEKIGVTFQQLQKYENGSNRVSAGRLFLLSRILKIPVNYFYDGFQDEAMNSSLPIVIGGVVMEQEAIFGSDFDSGEESVDPMQTPEISKLVMAYSRIQDVNLKKNVMDLVLSLSSLGKNMDFDK